MLFSDASFIMAIFLKIIVLNRLSKCNFLGFRTSIIGINKIGGGYMRKFFFIILSISLLILSACVDTNEKNQNTKITGKTQSLEQFYSDSEIKHIDKILIRDGGTGASKTVTEQKQIDEFITLVKDIIFTPQDNQERSAGWSYEITLYDGDNQFLFYSHYVDGVYYDSNPDILPILDTYYKQLNIIEE